MLHSTNDKRAVKALLLFAVTVVTRLPFTSRFLYNWDSVQYALGTESYNITYHQPHPPGYLLYVAAGKALNLLTDNPNQSFILLSILASGLAVSSLYLFGARAMGDGDGAYAALLLLFNPVFWFYGEITSTYALECLMAILIGWTCFRVRDGEDRLAPWVGVLLGIAGGIRQGTVILLLPLVVFSLRRASARYLLASAAAFVSVALAWLLPMLHLAGGLGTYLEATAQLSAIDTWRWSFHGVAIGLQNLARLASATGLSLHILVPIMVAFLLRFFPLADRRAPWEKWFVLWWVVPSALPYVLHYGQPGYVLIYLPAILLYSPPLVRGFLNDLKVRIHRDTGRPVGFGTQKASLAILALVGFVGTALFLRAPWEASAHSIMLHDMRWERILALTERFHPNDTIVLTGFSTTGSFRHASYYLPEYLLYCIGVDDEVGVYGWVFRTQHKAPSYDLSHIELHDTIPLPPNVQYVLVLDRAIAAASDTSMAEIPVAPGNSAYVLDLGNSQAPHTLVFQDHRLRLR
jgi:hypothetical protein